MKNEREVTMKRLICVFLILCLLPACAFGVDIDLFNDYAGTFHAPELKDGAFDGKYTTFTSEGCTIYFREMEDDLIIYVSGDGDPFFAYCVAAIMYIEPDSSALSYNCGMLLSYYLLTEEQETFPSYAGNLMMIQRRDNGYMFAVNRK